MLDTTAAVRPLTPPSAATYVIRRAHPGPLRVRYGVQLQQAVRR